MSINANALSCSTNNNKKKKKLSSISSKCIPMLKLSLFLCWMHYNFCISIIFSIFQIYMVTEKVFKVLQNFFHKFRQNRNVRCGWKKKHINLCSLREKRTIHYENQFKCNASARSNSFGVQKNVCGVSLKNVNGDCRLLCCYVILSVYVKKEIQRNFSIAWKSIWRSMCLTHRLFSFTPKLLVGFRKVLDLLRKSLLFISFSRKKNSRC